MQKDYIEETFEVYSEFAKHILRISNKNDILHLSLMNVNTGLYFEDVFNLEKLNQVADCCSTFSTIDVITKDLCTLIKKKKFKLTTGKNQMLLTFLNFSKSLPELPVPLPYVETSFFEEGERILQKRDIDLILKKINPTRPLKLKLIYKASRDGDSPQIFHSKVDGVKNTVTVILTDKGFRCGGFITKEWASKGEFSRDDPDSFLFSLERREFYLVSSEGTTHYNNGNYGPTFGKGFDLVVGDNCSSFFNSNQHWSKFPTSYGDISSVSQYALTGGYQNFLVREIETYEVLFNEDFEDDEDEDE